MAPPRHQRPRRLARPYTIVGGRSLAAGWNLPVEAQVARTTLGEQRLPRLAFEAREIVLLSSEPVSLAELAARLRVPLGVARVLVSDLAVEGLVSVDRGAGDERPGVILLERVLHGLRAI